MNLIDQLKRLVFFARMATPQLGGKRNNRLAARRAQNRKAAFIWCDQSQDWRECVILDFSAMGARIELRDRTLPLPLPQEWVTLCVAVDDLEVDGQVVWRRGRHLGMYFSGPSRPISRHPPAVSQWWNGVS